MTRYTKLEKKKYEKAAGFEGYNIKPLQPDKVVSRENPEITEVTNQKNKRKIQPDLSINKEESNSSESGKKHKKKRKSYKIKKSEEKNNTGIYNYFFF